jgi:hypothetical protein
MQKLKVKIGNLESEIDYVLIERRRKLKFLHMLKQGDVEAQRRVELENRTTTIIAKQVYLVYSNL